MLNPRPIPTKREDLFVDKYNRLLAWSLQITERDHELAEDLLHDLFIQFTLNEADLSRISNLDGYLYTMLRNLHLAKMRREQRNTLQQLSMLEYDSAEVGLRTVDLRDQIQAQDDLRRVCQYACLRKQTAKLGSVLILRFFHGYYPEELVQVLRSQRPAIDNWLRLARHEAKACLDERLNLEFINHNQIPQALPGGYAKNVDAFLYDLRQIIFDSRVGDCFRSESLRQLYLSNDFVPLGCSQLDHIVSCPVCLDEVSRLLGLPLLSQRVATETLGRDNRKRRGGSGKGTGGTGLSKFNLNSYRRRAKDTFEHKPQELCVSVNGFTRGSQRINSPRSELNLIVDQDEPVAFVEVFTEQKFRLLLMNVEELPPHGPGEHVGQVKLSDERSLAITLRFASPSPTIQLLYVDPDFQEAKEVAFSDDPTSLKPTENPPVRPTLLPVNSSSENGDHQDPTAAPRRSRFRAVAKTVLNWQFWLRPQTVTIVFTLLLIGAFAYFNSRNRSTNLTSGLLLSRARSSEDAILSRTDAVLHRTYIVEEREPSGRVISRQRVELWHDAAKHVTARRLYDDNGLLLSGEWTKENGPTVYRSHHAVAQPHIAIRGDWSGSDNVEVWQLSPAAKDFTSLIGNSATAQVEERVDAYVISAKPAQSGEVVKASVTLSRVDLHPTELTLLVENSSGLREFRLTEIAIERRAFDSVAPSIFEPDPELVVPHSTSATSPSTKKEALPKTLTPPASVIATSDFEVEVMHLLNQAGADVDDQTTLTRNSDGKLLISGVVETSNRKAEIIRALAPVINNPALMVNIETVAEVVSRQKETASSVREANVQRIEITKSNIPVHEDLQHYLAATKKDDSELDNEVRRFAASILNRSRLVMSEAGALKRLAGQFSKEDLSTMSPEARSKWLRVLQSHARNCEQEIRRLRLELQPVFSISRSVSAETDRVEFKDDAALIQSTVQLFDLVSSADRLIRAAFAISSEQSVTSTIRAPKFWELLKRTESLAGSISHIQ